MKARFAILLGLQVGGLLMIGNCGAYIGDGSSAALAKPWPVQADSNPAERSLLRVPSVGNSSIESQSRYAQDQPVDPNNPGGSRYQEDSSPDTASATPPHHRASHYASHGKMATHHRGKGPQTTGSANQLNQEELARLQAGNSSNPPAPGMAPRSAPTRPGRMPAGGRKVH
jgi:hypothetical protein